MTTTDTDKVIFLRVPAELKERVELAAKKIGYSVNVFSQWALEEYCDKHEGDEE